jgi:hypothetical protein
MVFSRSVAMKHLARALAAVASCSLLLSACQDRHEPVKPTVATHVQTVS